MPWDGDEYQRRFDRLAAGGADVHGEADLVRSLAPASVLDAGCGTGRVAVELARHGIEVVGVDVDPSMLATARRTTSAVAWVEADLASLDLGRHFDVVVMAGNVLLFTGPGKEADVITACAAHVGAGGTLLSGFELGRAYELVAYDASCAVAGLELVDRWSTWGRSPFTSADAYAVSAHRRAP